MQKSVADKALGCVQNTGLMLIVMVAFGFRKRIKTLLLTHVEICLWRHCGRAEEQIGHNEYKIKQKTCEQQA